MNTNKAILLAGAAAMLWGTSSVPAGADGAQSSMVQVPLPGQPAAAPHDITPQNAAPGGGTADVVTTNQVSSATNYLGDTLIWSKDITAGKTNASQTPDYCIPAKTKLIGNSDKLSAAAVTTSTTAGAQPVSLPTKSTLEVLLKDKANWAGMDIADYCLNTDHTNMTFLKDGQPAYVSTDDLDLVNLRSGWDFGALAVPFKIQLTGKNAISGSASLGVYAGYRFPVDTSIVLRPVVFVGGSYIPTSSSSGGTTTSQTVAGFSYGVGLLTNIKDSLQAGVVLGFDHVDSAQPYAYNDKPWISFEIGYSFAQ